MCPSRFTLMHPLPAAHTSLASHNTELTQSQGLISPFLMCGTGHLSSKWLCTRTVSRISQTNLDFVHQN